MKRLLLELLSGPEAGVQHAYSILQPYRSLMSTYCVTGMRLGVVIAFREFIQ